MGLVDQFGVEVVPYLLLTDAQGNITRLFLLARTSSRYSPHRWVSRPQLAGPNCAGRAPALPPAGVNPPNG